MPNYFKEELHREKEKEECSSVCKSPGLFKGSDHRFNAINFKIQDLMKVLQFCHDIGKGNQQVRDIKQDIIHTSGQFVLHRTHLQPT